MASEIAHVIYADRFLKKKPIAKDWGEFMLGNLFPDIRRVSNVTRGQTHNNFESLDLEFEGLTDFEKGWKFHVWCDMRRFEILNQTGYYDLKEVGKYSYLSGYHLEDVLIWEKFSKWDSFANFLMNVGYRNVLKEVGKNDWSFWYEALANYFRQKPNTQTIKVFCKTQPSVSPVVESVVEGVEILGKSNKIAKTISNLYQEII